MEDKIGRTFSDLIAEHPKTAFLVIILCSLSGLFIVLQGYSVKIWDIELISGSDLAKETAETVAAASLAAQPVALFASSSQNTPPIAQPVAAFTLAPQTGQPVAPDIRASSPVTGKLQGFQPDDFEEFIGLRYHDALGKAVEAFGAPTKAKNNAVVYTQNGKDILTVKCNRDKRVDFIELNGEAGRDFVKSKKTGDRKFKLLGLNISEIEAHLGKPDRVSGDRYAYQTGRIKTTFLCPKDSSFQCVGITVEWEY